MPQARDEAGNIWETDAAGNPVRLVQPAGGGRQATIIANPYRQREEGRKDQATALDQERLNISRQAESRQAATLPYDVQKAQADAVTAQAQAAAAAKEQANAPSPQTAKVQSSLQTDNVLGMIGNAREQIGQGWSTGNVFGTGAFQGFPVAGQNATNLSGTLEGLQGNVINDILKQLKAASANGSSGYGSLTETEAQRLAAAVASLKQTQDAPTLLNNLAQVEKHYRNALALLNNEDPRDPAVAAKYGVQDKKDEAALPAANRRTPDGQVTSEGNMESDPSLGGANATVERYIREGRDEGYIRNYLNQIRPGLGDKAEGIDKAISYNRQYPKDPLNIDLEKQWVPAGGVQKALGDAALYELPGGFSPGAAVIGAADTLSMGTLDNLTANPELSRATMSGVSENNPMSYFGGQIGGGALGGIGLEAGLGRLGLGGLAQARTGDAAFGALYGAGSADDEGDSRISAALLGAGSGLAGGALGRTAARAGGRALTGVRDSVANALTDRGIRMTPGQILGGGAKAWEDRLAGFPIVGDTIRARRLEGMEDFNRAAFDEALAPIGASTNGVTQEAGVDIARALRSQAYDDALNGVNVQADAPFVGDMSAAIAAGRALPDPMASNLDYTLPTRVGNSFDPQGNMTGRDFQQSVRGLRRDASSMENLPYGYDFGQVTRQAEGALEGLLQRQSPGTMEAYGQANEANRLVETLRDAVNRARNGTRSGEVGTFSPSQLSDAAARTAKLYGNSQGTTNQPFFELARAGQEALPSSIPDSGTAGRIAIPAIAAALAGGGGAAASEDGSRTNTGLASGAIAALLASAPYSAASRNILQRSLLAERPAQMVRVGDTLINNSRIAGLLAAPSLVEYTGQ